MVSLATYSIQPLFYVFTKQVVVLLFDVYSPVVNITEEEKIIS